MDRGLASILLAVMPMRSLWHVLALSAVGSLAACATHSSVELPEDASSSNRATQDATLQSTLDATVGDAAVACRSDADCTERLSSCIDAYRSCGGVPTLFGMSCDSDHDCSPQGLICSEAGDAGSGSQCIQATACTSDSDCSGERVCSNDPRPLYSVGSFCLMPCATDDDCAPVDTCDEGGHCRTRTCAECPSYFSCSNEACYIANCTDDRQCPGGYCVNKRCSEALGVCQPICL